MNVSEPFIQRPIATSLLMVAIALFGAVAYRALPVSDLPNVDFPTLLVTASLPGASPETMASAVATPLEKQFTTIAGIDNMVSSSSLGSTSITIQFTLDRSIDAAAQDVRGAVQFLKGRRIGSGKVGVTGFCMGGALTILSLTMAPEADAGVDRKSVV